MKTATINVNDVVPGMKAYGDVFNDMGLLIFNSGFVLKESSVAKLALYGIKNITVEIPDNVKYDLKGDNLVNAESNYAKRVRQKEEFKEFVVTYEEEKKKVIDSISAIAEGKLVSKSELLEMPSEVSKKFVTNRDLFEFLGNLPLDDVTYTHSLNVSIISKTFGKWIELPQKDVDELEIAGLLHDIGKTKIPKSILDKPDKLTSEEFEEIKKHPVYSYRMAQNLDLSTNILKGILMHHERYNGSGYPMGAKGNQIHLFAKIIGIADVFEAMTSIRVYRSKICPFKVLDVMEKEGYINFEPSIISKILENIANSYVGADIRLNTGQIGKIIFINKRAVARPIIEVNNSMFDLSKESEAQIYIEEMV